jgi:hypothetical protein
MSDGLNPGQIQELVDISSSTLHGNSQVARSTSTASPRSHWHRTRSASPALRHVETDSNHRQGSTSLRYTTSSLALQGLQDAQGVTPRSIPGAEPGGRTLNQGLGSDPPDLGLERMRRSMSSRASLSRSHSERSTRSVRPISITSSEARGGRRNWSRVKKETPTPTPFRHKGTRKAHRIPMVPPSAVTDVWVRQLKAEFAQHDRRVELPVHSWSVCVQRKFRLLTAYPVWACSAAWMAWDSQGEMSLLDAVSFGLTFQHFSVLDHTVREEIVQHQRDSPEPAGSSFLNVFVGNDVNFDDDIVRDHPTPAISPEHEVVESPTCIIGPLDENLEVASRRHTSDVAMPPSEDPLDREYGGLLCARDDEDEAMSSDFENDHTEQPARTLELSVHSPLAPRRNLHENGDIPRRSSSPELPQRVDVSFNAHPSGPLQRCSHGTFVSLPKKPYGHGRRILRVAHMPMATITMRGDIAFLDSTTWSAVQACLPTVI